MGGPIRMDEPRARKEPYVKPVLRRIDLAAEEVLAVGCKTVTGPPAPFGFSCTANNCVQAGS